MLPFLALVFLIIDTSYGIFLQATLQNAVQMAASFAASDPSAGSPGATSLSAGIQSAVQTQLPAATITAVNYYAPANLTTPLGGASVLNAAGNVVEIDAAYTFTPLAPLFRNCGICQYTLSATASTVLAAYPPAPL